MLSVNGHSFYRMIHKAHTQALLPTYLNNSLIHLIFVVIHGAAPKKVCLGFGENIYFGFLELKKG